MRVMFPISTGSVVFVAIIGCMIATARAAVPFYSGAGTAVDPQIATLAIGVADTVERAVVSADHKYVTLDMSPQVTASPVFRTFTFQRPGIGFVGSASAQQAVMNSTQTQLTPAPKSSTLTPGIKTDPKQIGLPPAPPSILDQPGMTRLSPMP